MNKKKVALCICLFVSAGILVYIFSKRQNSLFEGFEDCSISIYPPQMSDPTQIEGAINNMFQVIGRHPWTTIAVKALDPNTNEGSFLDFNSPHYDCLKSQLNHINKAQKQGFLIWIEKLITPLLNKVQNLVSDLEKYISDIQP